MRSGTTFFAVHMDHLNLDWRDVVSESPGFRMAFRWVGRELVFEVRGVGWLQAVDFMGDKKSVEKLEIGDWVLS